MNGADSDVRFRGRLTPGDIATGSTRIDGWRRYVSSVPDALEIDFLLEASVGFPLVVSFHGYTDRTRYTYPRFERRRSFGEAGFSVLYIADPTLTLNSEIELGWYLGSPRVDLASVVAELIDEVMVRYRAPSVLLVGSSGGGFAALQVASLRDTWRALAFSPQTSVLRYYRSTVDKLSLGGFPGFDEMSSDSILRSRLSLDAAFTRPRREAVVCVQNTKDSFHMRNHFVPFASARPEGILLVLEDHGEGHRPPPVERVCAWVERLLG
jgi:pimeloyl-ACP methyl ester carboxylesterase